MAVSVTFSVTTKVRNRGSTKLQSFGFQWQNLTEILPKVLQSENKAVIMITSPLYNICLQQM